MTLPTVSIPPLTLSEAMWLETCAEAQRRYLRRQSKRHELADNVLEKIQRAVTEAVTGVWEDPAVIATVVDGLYPIEP